MAARVAPFRAGCAVVVFPSWDCICPMTVCPAHGRYFGAAHGDVWQGLGARDGRTNSFWLTSLNAATQRVPATRCAAKCAFSPVVGDVSTESPHYGGFFGAYGICGQSPTVTEPGDSRISAVAIKLNLFPAGDLARAALILFGDTLDGGAALLGSLPRSATTEKAWKLIELAPSVKFHSGRKRDPRFRQNYRSNLGPRAPMIRL